jgi:succinate dehydrogenase / fumarate reductase, membrane anchor subunit
MSTPHLRPTAGPTKAHIRTPLARARGLGSAKEGTDHFWKQRVTGVANMVLTMFLVGLIVSLIGADYATVKKTLAHPFISIALLLLVLAGVYHMRLGMQTIIEDYVHSEGRKLVCLMLNTFFAASVAMASIYAVARLALSA